MPMNLKEYYINNKKRTVRNKILTVRNFLCLDFLFLHVSYADCHNNSEDEEISGNHLTVSLNSCNNHEYTAGNSKNRNAKSLKALEILAEHHLEEDGDVERIDCDNGKLCGVKCKHAEFVAESAEL